MARTYTLSSGGLTLAGQPVTLAFLNPDVDNKIEILRCSCGQTESVTSAQQRVQLVTQVTAFPTLTSKTPVPHRLGDAASTIVGGTAGAAGTSGVNASAEGAGAKTVLLEEVFNLVGGWLWVPAPAETIILAPSAASGFGLFLPVTAPSLTNWSVSITYREV